MVLFDYWCGMLCVPHNKALFIAPIFILSIIFNASAADRPAGWERTEATFSQEWISGWRQVWCFDWAFIDVFNWAGGQWNQNASSISLNLIGEIPHVTFAFILLIIEVTGCFLWVPRLSTSYEQESLALSSLEASKDLRAGPLSICLSAEGGNVIVTGAAP